VTYGDTDFSMKIREEIKARIREGKLMGCNGVLVFNLTFEEICFLDKKYDIERRKEYDFDNFDTMEGYEGFMLSWRK